jgi:hypothetical protein
MIQRVLRTDEGSGGVAQEVPVEDVQMLDRGVDEIGVPLYPETMTGLTPEAVLSVGWC